MKTAELIDHVAGAADIEKKAARKAVEAVLNAIVDAAQKGDVVNLTGFGTFKVKDSPARQGGCVSARAGGQSCGPAAAAAGKVCWL